MKYERVPIEKVPVSKLRFDTPRRNQGQIVEAAYGSWATSKGENDEGAPFKKVTDRSLPCSHPERTTYYKLTTEII